MPTVTPETTGLPPRVLKAAAGMLRAVSHPARLKIIELLMAHNELTVGEMTEHLKLAQHVVSGHLKELRAVNVVAGQRDGRCVRYRLINPDAAGVIQCIRRHHFRPVGFLHGDAI